MSLSRRDAIWMVFALTSVLVVAGCSTQRASTRSSEASTSASSPSQSKDAAPSPTTSKAPPPPKITGEQLGGTAQALDTVFKPCDPGISSFDKPVSVFDPKTGRLVEAPVPPAIPAGAELFGGGNSSYGCTLAGTPDDLKIFYVWNYKSPSKGLEPATTHLMAGVAGINDKSMTQVVELPAELGGAPSGVMPTDGGPVLWYCCGAAVAAAAIDPNTLAVKWTSEHGIASHDRSSVAFYDVFEDRFTVKDVASGAETVVEHVNPTTASGINNYVLERGYLLDQVGDGDNVGNYSTVARQFFPNVLTNDRVTGAGVNEGRLLLIGKDTLKIVDVASGTVLFGLTPEEKSAVDSYQFANSGEYLYVANQSDSPVIDIRNRQQVSAGWKVRPQTFLGKSWVLVDHRRNATQDCYEGTSVFGCGGSGDDAEDVVLEHVREGVYPGPWF